MGGLMPMLEGLGLDVNAAIRHSPVEARSMMKELEELTMTGGGAHPPVVITHPPAVDKDHVEELPLKGSKVEVSET